MLKTLKKGILFIFGNLIISCCLSQDTFFKKDDRICFVGNSITQNGEFYHNILLYYVTRFPNKPIHLFNCGISGDVTNGILERMDSDILIHNPNKVVLMIGMNDVNRSLYSAKPIFDADTLQKREAAINTYKFNLEKIVEKLLAVNVEVVLQTPTIFDQTAVIKKENNFGVNDALKTCATFIQYLSNKYHLQLIDYYSILNRINAELQIQDSAFTIIGPDRVHPGSNGHLIMTYQFLRTTDESQKIKHTELLNFKNDGRTIVFQMLESGLPFPISANQKLADSLVNFSELFNQEILKVKNIKKKASYKLLIDSILIGNFSGMQLQDGINLALYNTSQMKQAQLVKSILLDSWKVESDLRNIQFVEIKHLKNFEQKNDLAATEKYLNNLSSTTFSSNSYFKNQFDKYVSVKPKENQLNQQLLALREKAYAAAIPITHYYQLIKL